MPLVVIGLMLGIGFFLLWHMPRPKVTGNAAKMGLRVDVIIPARNEAHRIAPLLESLRLQTFYPQNVLVVDDGSTDDTAAIARRFGANVASAGPRPEGWNGKTWACWQGVQKSDGDLLVFLDADTWLAPDGLEALVDTYLQQGGLLAVQPYHVTQRFYEQFSAFFNIVLMASINAFTPFGDRLAPGGAFGPCMVCSRADYLRVGGHRAVRTKVIEDIPLGKRFLREGLLVRCRAGRGILSFRMYPGGFGEMLEGWSKGFGYGALAVRPWATILVSAWITACFSISVSLLKQALNDPLSAEMLARLALYLVGAGQVFWMLRRIGRFQAWVAPLFFVPLFFFGLVMLRSSIMTYVLGRVRWKGYEISTNHHTRGAP